MNKFFVYSPDMGMEFFDTKEEQEKAAKEQIMEYCDMQDGWQEDVTSVVMGEVTHQAQKTNVVKQAGELDEDGYDDNGVHWDGTFESTCNYEMLPIKEEL